MSLSAAQKNPQVLPQDFIVHVLRLHTLPNIVASEPAFRKRREQERELMGCG